MNIEYIKHKQRQLEKKWRLAEKLEAEKEAKKEAEILAEARRQEEIAARKKLLLEQQEAKRLHQKHVQRKEKLVEQKWNKQVDTLLTQVKDCLQEDNKLEEIRIIIHNREPSLQELDWASWLSDPLNQRLADLDFNYAMEMFKRDNLMAKRRSKTRGRTKKNLVNYALSFTGNSAAATRTYDYVATDFNPDDYDLHLGCTVSYWVKPDETGNTMFAFGRKHNNQQRFTFGINRHRQGYFAIGQNKLTTSWVNMDTPLEESLLEESGQYWNIRKDMWYHMVLTYDDRTDTSSGADRKIYVNGVLRHTNTVNWSETGGDTGGIYFGGRNLADAYQNGWACKLDEVAIFNTAKDSNWVASVYSGGTSYDHKISDQSGLVGYWKFNEGSGIIVKDHSGNGNHGTFGAISGNTTAYPTWGKR